MSQTPSVAVGVPVFNESLYVRETIASLKTQTSGGFTAFVSDNCSTDGTFDIVQKEIGGDPRFRVIQHPRNLGALFNFEYLLKVAGSDYFMWVGGHDQLSPNAIERLSEMLNSDPDVSMAMAYPHSITQSGQHGGRLAGAVYDFTGSPIERYIQSVERLNDCTIFHAMFRRNLATSFRFEPVFGADLPFISMLLWHGRLVYDDQSAYFRRMFPEERTAQQMERVTGDSAATSSYQALAQAYIRAFRHLHDVESVALAATEHEISERLIARFGLANSTTPQDACEHDLAPCVSASAKTSALASFLRLLGVSQ